MRYNVQCIRGTLHKNTLAPQGLPQTVVLGVGHHKMVSNKRVKGLQDHSSYNPPHRIAGHRKTGFQQKHQTAVDTHPAIENIKDKGILISKETFNKATGYINKLKFAKKRDLLKTELWRVIFLLLFLLLFLVFSSRLYSLQELTPQDHLSRSPVDDQKGLTLEDLIWGTSWKLKAKNVLKKTWNSTKCWWLTVDTTDPLTPAERTPVHFCETLRR